ncbi:hypothetical protein JM658_12695 [Joostella atrarenae]|uniref:Tetratricopeptide repeat protein n=1 Tax=Joostella atrarenae TaxID=679257 RepID=A0ABS9J5I2_9FLAO|nr:hypothetical protein [Joostella atrarenae]MCF8715686.1 hypothetical protein [Joostella atrarenae]
MSLSREEVIKHIERAEMLYNKKYYSNLESHLLAIQENYSALGNDSLEWNARYIRIFTRYLGVFKDVNVGLMQTYLEALENIKQVQASDYEFICSYYKKCSQEVYEKALIAYPYNDTLHIHYALKLQVEKRYTEAIEVLKYVLECYPATTEARILLWEIETSLLEELCNSPEEADCYKLLDLASSTHNLKVLKGLQIDNRLDAINKSLTYIQVALWENRPVEVVEQWNSEWKNLELTDRIRYLFADYAKSYMKYDLVIQVLKAPKSPNFPDENYIDFSDYRNYMNALVSSEWQLAQHHYVLLGNAAYHYTKNNKDLRFCVEHGLAINPKNPLLLVLKAEFFYSELDYNETAAAYHEAYRNGLSIKEYLFYLLEVNNRTQSWQTIIDIVEQFHLKNLPTLKTLFFKARALVMLEDFDKAHEVINEALEGFPLPPHSYAPWLFNLRMIIHKKNHNYKAFLKDMQEEVNYYNIGDSEYCSTINMCVETIFEMGDYEECYKFAIYNYEQEQLSPELYPIFHWLCYYDFLIEKPEGLADLTEEDLILNPETFSDYRNNGLIYWVLENHQAAAEALELAATKATNKAYYLKLAFTCANEGFLKQKSIAICETIKVETPAAREWKTDYYYAGLLVEKERYKEGLEAYLNLILNYPDRSFYDCPKDDTNFFGNAIKTCAKKLEDVNQFTKYNAMFLSKDNPSEKALKEHQEIARTAGKDDLFLRHNLLEGITRLDIALSDEEQKELKQLKSIIRETYFA